jgi:hypothetical protein
MAVALTSPVTGGAQTGFTAPTYTITPDVAPDVNGKQWAVTVCGGTQVGVRIHSSSDPFTVTYVRPKAFKAIGKPHPVTGLLPSVPKNTHVFMVRKGAIPLSNQPASVLLIRCSIDIPAGSDITDASSLRAAVSLLVGALNQLSAGLGDTLVSGLS